MKIGFGIVHFIIRSKSLNLRRLSDAKFQWGRLRDV